MIQIDWDYIDKACRHLADRLKKDGREFNYVWGIPRGGLIIAVKMSHLLDVPLKPSTGMGGDKVLLVDDICDTGLTMKVHATDISNVTTLAIHKHIHSKFEPDYYYEEIDDWIQYPWETINTSCCNYKNEKKKKTY